MDGTPFGRYRLVELLGRGGMGEVWRAYDTAIDRVVALKVLHPNFADDQDFQKRFRREAKAAAGLDEPHVVPIHDFGEIDGRLYVTMRLIKGRDLQHLLVDGPLPPNRTVKIIEQISSALHAAHEIGLVHRDVKPSNILVAKDDFAYLIDFGIARAAGETKLTKTGAIIGTLAYMAPERFTTGVADARADIYSLACVLYECLTGTQPYPGDSAEQQITAHLTLDPPRPSSRNPAIPGAFDEVIACGMAKQPAERFSSAGELAKAASAAAASSHSPNDRGPRKPGGTRGFSARWPNPDGTGDTPYPEHLRVSEPRERKLGRGPLVLVAAAVLTFLAAALIAALLILRENRGTPSGSDVTAAPTRSASDMTTASPTARLSSSAKQPQSSLSGTDVQGFVGYPGARCDPGDTPAVMGRTAKKGHSVEQLDDIRKLDLRAVDKVASFTRLHYAYSASAAVEGAAAGLVIGGGEAAVAFGGVAGAGAGAAPGLGAITAAMGADVAALLIACSRVIAHDALYYGYDPRDPAEEVFMMQIIGLGMAATPSAKAVAYQQLAILTRSLATNMTWRQLNQQTFVKVAQKFATKFGQRLTKKKLGQFVPIAGVGIGAAMNWKMVDDVANAAYWVYRERFLYEKGGDLPPIVIDAEVDDAMAEDGGDASIDVIDILESEGIVLDDDDDGDQDRTEDESPR